MRNVLLLLLFLFCCHAATGQTLQITGNPPSISISTAAELVNGKQISHQTLNVVNPLIGILPVELYVRVSGDLQNGSNTIPASVIGVLVTSPTSTPDPERMLSTTNQRLLAYQPPLIGLASTPVTLRYRLTGGTSFFRPAGTYSTTIVYTLTLD